MCCPSWTPPRLRHSSDKRHIWFRTFFGSRRHNSSLSLSRKILRPPVIYYIWCIESNFYGSICRSPAEPHRNTFSGISHSRFLLYLWNESHIKIYFHWPVAWNNKIKSIIIVGFKWMSLDKTTQTAINMILFVSPLKQCMEWCVQFYL